MDAKAEFDRPMGAGVVRFLEADDSSPPQEERPKELPNKPL
jgi:hypothetical protein